MVGEKRMKGKHDYSIKAIDESVNVLQESFFDIYFRQIGSLSFLMSKMEGLSENEKSKISALVERQSAKLNQSMELLNQLVSIVKSIDADGKRIEALSFNIMEKTGTPIGSAVLPRARRKKPDTLSIPVPAEDIKVDEVADNPVREEVQEETQPTVEENKIEETNETVEDTSTTEVVSEEVSIPTVDTPSADVTEEVKEDVSGDAVEVPKAEDTTEAVTTTETPSEEVSVPTVDTPTTDVTEEVKEDVSSEVVEVPAVDAPATDVTEETATAPEGDAKSDVVLEIPTVTATENTDEPVLTPVGEQTEENSIFNQPVEQPEEERKNLISGTPEQVNREMAEMFRKLPGMENIKIGKNGIPDFNSILPPDVVEEMNATTGKEGLSGLVSLLAARKRGSLPIQPVLEYENNGEAGEGNNEQSIFGEAKVEGTTTEEANTANIVPTVAPPAAPTESVVSANDITAEITDALQNINNNEGATSDASSEGDGGTVAPLIPVIAEEETTEAKVEDPAFGETGLRRFINVGTQTRAILVSESQFNKLSGSRVTQEALLKFKHILPEGSSSATPAVVNDVSNMTEEEKKKTIEVMMADATELYNSGKVEEAQAMYDKISELNNTVVEG